MAHTPGLGLMFTEFDASTLKAHVPVPRRGKNELKFIINSGADGRFIVPTTGQLNDQYQSYNWIIHWGDGVIETCTGTEANGSGISHVYPNVNTEYEIAISPADPDELGWLRAFSFNDSSGSEVQTNKDKVLRITSGELTEQAIRTSELDMSTCAYMFSGCKSLTSIGDFNLPQDITVVGNNFCSSLFNSCTSLTSLGDLQISQGIIEVSSDFCASMFTKCYKLETIPTSFFGDLQLSQVELDEKNVFKLTFSNCSIATGDMAGVPMLQLSPTVRNQCFSSTPNVLNVPTNWK